MIHSTSSDGSNRVPQPTNIIPSFMKYISKISASMLQSRSCMSLNHILGHPVIDTMLISNVKAYLHSNKMIIFCCLFWKIIFGQYAGFILYLSCGYSQCRRFSQIETDSLANMVERRLYLISPHFWHFNLPENCFRHNIKESKNF